MYTLQRLAKSLLIALGCVVFILLMLVGILSLGWVMLKIGPLSVPILFFLLIWYVIYQDTY